MQELKIWENKIPFYKEDLVTPNFITTYLLDTDREKPCVVVVPGGAYANLAQDHEGHQVAQFFNRQGLNAVVVHYRVSPNRYPAPLADLQRSIRVVRANAKAWKVDPKKVIVCGFSAGGHLCGSSMLIPDVYTEEFGKDEIDNFSCKPDGGILCYPVISIDSEFGHRGSGKNLLGEERYAQEKEKFCLEKLVTPKTPKTFLFHTAEDKTVNVKNSLIFAENLQKNGVPVELHVFPYGSHGVGLAEQSRELSKWPYLAVDWIDREFGI